VAAAFAAGAINGCSTLLVAPRRCRPIGAGSLQVGHRCSPHKGLRSGPTALAAGIKADEGVDAAVALIVPGFLGSAGDFEQLAVDMTAAGYPAVVAPIEWWHWIPCIGGRSMRPIIERIDHAIDQMLASGPSPQPLRAPAYTLLDLLMDFGSNPGGVLKVGGSRDPSEYPNIEPCGEEFTTAARERRRDAAIRAAGPGTRVTLVGHSAAGWIARIFLSGVPYSGRTYNGNRKVHSLVCLGSPHFPAKSLAFDALRYLEKQDEGSAPPQMVRCLCVGSSGTPLAGASDMTRGAYEMCGADPDDGGVQGDGMTPLFSALAFKGADQLVVDDVSHAPEYPALGPSADLAKRRQDGQPWYGSRNILERWLPWLMAPSDWPNTSKRS